MADGTLQRRPAGDDLGVPDGEGVRIALLPDFIRTNTSPGQFVVDRDRYVDR